MPIELLKARFPYQWRVLEGEFCGSHYTQCPKTHVISLRQRSFVEKLKPAYLPRGRTRQREALLDQKEVSVLRAINGSLKWLAGQTRPDLAAQTSFSQQVFPGPYGS